VNGLEGDEVTPAGRPEDDTVIELENPFFAATDTTAGGLVVPQMAVSVDGPTEKLKSGGGGGDVVVPPPQPDSIAMMIAVPSTAMVRDVIRVSVPPRVVLVTSEFALIQDIFEAEHHIEAIFSDENCPCRCHLFDMATKASICRPDQLPWLNH
jgi:hypothetical protein